MTETLLTVEDVAGRLHCTPRTVREMVRTGRLQATRPAKRFLIPESALEALLQSKMTAGRRRRGRVA